MKFVEAYNDLGYSLGNHRQDWSAEKPDGVCISLWKVEIQWQPSPPVLDGFSLWPDGVPGSERPGFAKRLRHLKRAATEFGGDVDVVVLHGTPGKGYGVAEPWRRGSKWRITRFDPTNGNFRAEVIVDGKERE
jgi:hypothetical protein